MADIVPIANAVSAPSPTFHRPPGFYAVVWDGADGEHTGHVQLTEWNDKRAEEAARAAFGDMLRSIRRSDPQAQAKEVADNLAANPSRTPIEEKTGGKPNRALSDASLLEQP